MTIMYGKVRPFQCFFWTIFFKNFQKFIRVDYVHIGQSTDKVRVDFPLVDYLCLTANLCE